MSSCTEFTPSWGLTNSAFGTKPTSVIGSKSLIGSYGRFL